MTTVDLKDYVRVGLSIEVTVWDPDSDDENGVIFTSKVLDFREGRLFIDKPRGEEAVILKMMTPGMLVGVVMPTDSNLLMFYPVIASSEETSQFGVILKCTEEMQTELIQRRKLIRVPFSVPVEVDLLANGEVVHKIEALTENISGGGMRLLSPFQLEENMRLVVYLKLGDLRGKDAPPLESGANYSDRSVFKLQAKVVFAQERQGETKKEKYAIGVQFDQLSELQQTLLVKECFRRELTLKRNKLR
jgi:c-di-GMP-binding flagellar brake protein YcgR